MSEKEIFIGSSKEALDQAEQVARVLAELEGVRPTLWTQVFALGDITFVRIEEIARRVAGAVFLATPDDESVIREEKARVPRANVLFEFGYFTAMLARTRVALCRYAEVKLPTDFEGLTRLEMGAFQVGAPLSSDAREKLRAWAFALKPHGDYDALTQRLVYLLRHVQVYPRGARDKYWQVLDAFHDDHFDLPKKIKDPGKGWRTAIHESLRVLELLGLVARSGEQVWITDKGEACIAELSDVARYRHAFSGPILKLDLAPSFEREERAETPLGKKRD